MVGDANEGTTTSHEVTVVIEKNRHRLCNGAPEHRPHLLQLFAALSGLTMLVEGGCANIELEIQFVIIRMPRPLNSTAIVVALPCC